MALSGLVFVAGCLAVAEPPRLAAACSTDADCPGEYACDNGRCPTSCRTGSDCKFDASCDYETDECEHDCQDSECGAYTCDILENECYTECEYDFHCGDGYECSAEILDDEPGFCR